MGQHHPAIDCAKKAINSLDRLIAKRRKAANAAATDAKRGASEGEDGRGSDAETERTKTKQEAQRLMKLEATLARGRLPRAESAHAPALTAARRRTRETASWGWVRR